ncbi:hypothetical protein LU631_18535 [Erwinia tracheiphila]|nr:hypothetical protein [Erwinia tracheiphila]EOS96268.1 hypothetical protein ETR_03719 [Erwinia tracheiphila PSU-1]UIA86826.1 hypothetical protein LU631_18535 [Erwinia tracheiphila]UIA95183.1 hypothetical protein LU633_16995 [Erwinia tracheiphila]
MMMFRVHFARAVAYRGISVMKTRQKLPGTCRVANGINQEISESEKLRNFSFAMMQLIFVLYLIGWITDKNGLWISFGAGERIYNISGAGRSGNVVIFYYCLCIARAGTYFLSEKHVVFNRRYEI